MSTGQRPLVDVLFSIVVPAIILMSFSDDDGLGARNALLVALAFPVSVGVYELVRSRSANAIALLGVVSVLLTGGIGVLELDTGWLAVKEAGIPALIGAAVLVGARLGYPVIEILLFNPRVMNTHRIVQRLRDSGQEKAFAARLLHATYALSGTFFFSAAMNYVLTVKIVTSPAGTAAFNAELGRLTLISYPMIALPSMLMLVGILYFLWRDIRERTGLTVEEILDRSAPPQR